MKAAGASGTENYADEAPELLKRYESISFADAHARVLHLIPPAPCRVLDIGSGTGRDAAGLAALGHSVVAVEPTEELRRGAMLLHPSPMIERLDDSLPHLSVVRARGEEFDLVMLSAVWMHLDEMQRSLAMPTSQHWCARPVSCSYRFGTGRFRRGAACSKSRPRRRSRWHSARTSPARCIRRRNRHCGSPGSLGHVWHFKRPRGADDVHMLYSVSVDPEK